VVDPCEGRLMVKGLLDLSRWSDQCWSDQEAAPMTTTGIGMDSDMARTNIINLFF
jgi:hypothetical protein